MSYRMIATGWHNTLFGLPNDDLLYREIDKAAHPWWQLRGTRSGDIQRARRDIQERRQTYGHGSCTFDDPYASFDIIIAGASRDAIYKAVERYSQRNIRLAHEGLLELIRNERTRGKHVAVMSDSLSYHILSVLEPLRHIDTFEEVRGRGFVIDGDEKVTGLTPHMHGEKAALLEYFFANFRCNERTLLYLGGEGGDETIADFLPPGNALVSPYASPQQKERLVRSGAFVPENLDDLEKYLMSK